ncbi:hypothetical protein [Streptomyces sp. WMMB303]|uniref:hypothetical protein n=1 Tax=Streptomyces sp. WMMB303 TaxID=3034154 RepID=UPI0023EBDC34|nr:hypothetical protein [Streptomyces sp. WMMB303]MDF4251214.1 hypothetical protein [Streptomyces sp. WMMB303]
MKNRFAGGCATCSVWVFAGGGFLLKAETGWQVQCEECHRLDELAQSDDFDPEEIEPPTAPPSGCKNALALRVLGMTRECWKCGHPTICLVGLYPQQPARGYVGLHTTENEQTMILAQRLLQEHGRSDLAATVKSRYSKTARERRLSNGCGHCDALQGNFPVQEEAFARVVSAGGADGLETLLVADCPMLEWQAIVNDQGGGVICV